MGRRRLKKDERTRHNWGGWKYNGSIFTDKFGFQISPWSLVAWMKDNDIPMPEKATWRWWVGMLHRFMHEASDPET